MTDDKPSKKPAQAGSDSHSESQSDSQEDGPLAAPPPTHMATFADLELPAPLLAGLDAVGYEVPSPIQIKAIPHLLAGTDLVGRAPTGTGKTAAFALPLIARADLSSNQVQILVLTPTRELALQVSEAMATYAAQLKGFHVLPVYGGQDYAPQLQKLKRGVQAVVGTPGRISDHLRRGTLKLDGLQAVVLDEADEMLRMGFIDEVEWILEQTPAQRQVVLFSATMPSEVQAIARRHLRDPQQISIKARTATADTIEQRCWIVGGVRKMEALYRLLEVEPVDGVLVFARTRASTVDIAERLEQRGFSAAALNGDLAQRQREQTVERFKRGGLSVLVATDVAARGLDVDRISHVINFDVPYDTEAYIHRIGRTGRAGRSGQAILFVAPRERRMLSAIERATRQKIKPLELPTEGQVRQARMTGFKTRITEALGTDQLQEMRTVVAEYQAEHDSVALEDIAAALALLAGADRALRRPEPGSAAESEAFESRGRSDSGSRHRSRQEGRQQGRIDGRLSKRRPKTGGDAGFDRYRIEVGHDHGVQPGNIVGAIANEAGMDAANIGRVEIRDDHSTVQLPVGMPPEVFRDLQKVWVCGQALKLQKLESERAPRSSGANGKRSSFKKNGAANGARKADGKGKEKDKEHSASKNKKRPTKRELKRKAKKQK